MSRLVCESENYDLEMHVDVNTQLYPVDVGNKYTIVLASSISEDDSADKGYVAAYAVYVCSCVFVPAVYVVLYTFLCMYVCSFVSVHAIGVLVVYVAW